MKLRNLSHVSCLLIILLFIGCANSSGEEKSIPRTNAHKKFVKLCKDDYNLDVVTKAFENTLWVYLPLDFSFLEIAASQKGPSKSFDTAKSSETNKKMLIRFIHGKFEENTFKLYYDIFADASNNQYIDDRGITTKVSQEYTAKQRFLLSALTRIYADTEKNPNGEGYVERVEGDIDFRGPKENATHKKLVHDYVKTDKVPDFIVVIIADIKKGIETRMYLATQDLVRAASDQGFGEEYMKRVISEQPIGHEIIIDDKSGKHLETYDLTWGEFLSRQMVHRVNFKYQLSKFVPTEDTKEELLKIAADTVEAYTFENFNTLELHDLKEDSLYTIEKDSLSIHKTEKPKGRLIRINFEP